MPGIDFKPGKVYVREINQPTSLRLIKELKQAAAPGVTALIINSQASVRLIGATTDMEYSTDGGTSWRNVTGAIANGTTAIDCSVAGNKDLKVRIKATVSELASAATVKLNGMDLGGVDIDVLAGKITGTTTAMEYSLDSTDGKNGTWAVCTATTTTAVFVEGVLYVREKAMPSNYSPITVNRAAAPQGTYLNGYNILAGTITLDAAAPSNLQYRIGGGTWVSFGTEKTAYGVSFVQGNMELRATPTARTLASIPTIVGVIEAPGLPPNLSYSDKDNLISGLNGNYEYKIGTGAWVSGDKPGDFSGNITVSVRYKATAGKLASQIQNIPFKDNLNLKVVTLDINAGYIVGTTKAMQYSLDSTDGKNGTWKDCTDTNTKVTFVSGPVYVREKANTDNFELVGTVNGVAVPDVTGITYDIRAGSITVPAGLTTLQYRIAGGTWSDIPVGTTTGIAFAEGKLEFRNKGSGGIPDSNPVLKATILPRAAVPSLVAQDDYINVITGLDAVSSADPVYEYKIDSGSWTLGTVAGDFSGNKTVLVRKRATATDLPSQEQSIKFTASLDLDGVRANVAYGILTGTKVAFQYSLDAADGSSGTWRNCADGTTTGVPFDNGPVFVRAAADPTKYCQVAIITTPVAPDNTVLDQVAINIRTGTISYTGTESLQYSFNSSNGIDGTWQDVVPAGTTTNVAFISGNVNIRYKAGATNLESVGAVKTVILPPVNAPALAVDVTNRRILGLNSTYEYKIGAGQWISGEIVSNFNVQDTIWVRTKALADTMPSYSQCVYFSQSLDLSGVRYDIAAGTFKDNGVVITGSNMQYSLDSTNGMNGVWHDLPTPPAKIIFDAGPVYVREAAQPLNYQWVGTVPASTSINKTGIGFDISQGVITGTSDNMEYSIGNGPWMAVTPGGITKGINFIAGPVKVRAAATESTLPSIEEQIGSVIASPGAKPTLAWDDSTDTITGLGSKDVITGLPLYEYSLDDGATWTHGDIPGDFSGNKKIWVRYRATKGTLASEYEEYNFTL